VPFDPVGRFLVGVLAIALASACVAAALVERPPASRLPRAVVVLAAGWSLVFAASAVLVAASLGHLAICGLLVAAATVTAAGAIWAARAPEGGGGGDGGAGPDGPEPPSVPEEFWERWEEQLTGVTGRRR
jgi:hypothetical protein